MSSRMAAPSKVIDWLLGEENPPVRYLTLTRLLGRSAASAEVRRAKARLMDYRVTQQIENSLNGKMLADVEVAGRPSKWLTYFGHFVLAHF